MVEEKVREAQDQAESCYYSLGCVAHWLEHWRELQELALPTTPGIQYDRVSMSVPRGYRKPSQHHYAEVVADLDLACQWVSGWWWLARQMIEWIRAGCDLITVADRLRVEWSVAEKAWDDVCEVIAIDLGWKGR